jgi:hypothetical protein
MCKLEDRMRLLESELDRAPEEEKPQLRAQLMDAALDTLAARSQQMADTILRLGQLIEEIPDARGAQNRAVG